MYFIITDTKSPIRHTCLPLVVISYRFPFYRAFAESIQRPFGVRYNPYTQSVEVLSNAQKITALVRELRGDICIVSSAIKKISAQDSTLDVETIANMLHTGLQVCAFRIQLRIQKLKLIDNAHPHSYQ